jgi:hypothetical protein
MIGLLNQALETLLTGALPALLGGAPPAVQLSIAPDILTMDPNSSSAEAGEPRTDDHTDLLPFAVANPTGPYSLTQPPAPGPRRVSLVTSADDRISLVPKEILWDAADSKKFTLQPRPDRDLGSVTGVEVLYGVTAVFVKMKGIQNLSVLLQSSDAAKLSQAEALVMAVIDLNRKQLVNASAATFTDGDYTSVITISSLKVIGTSGPAANTRSLECQADVELKATRALGADEGKPIQVIRSPGLTVNAAHPVNINIGVDV